VLCCRFHVPAVCFVGASCCVSLNAASLLQVLLESFHESDGRLRLDEAGALRSKGFGFVEFAEHVHALAALRKLNNNPELAAMAAGGPAVCVMAVMLLRHVPCRLHCSFTRTLVACCRL
jgi:hypothetical protein